VLVTDANACTWTDTITLAEPEEAMIISNAAVVSVVCQNDPTGSISFEIGGGIPPYDYSWSNDATSQTLANLTGDDYSVTVTDANGCQLVNNFSVEFQFEDCNIEPPGGLTPYGEFDQTWIIRGLDQYENNSVKIFNRYGTMVYQANPYQNDWTGEPNLNRSLAESDGKLASGTYYYILLLEPGSEPLSGYIYLMKE
jgi:gliding motility-associated-like protein